VYSREVNGEILDFGVSGKLIMNVLVMYDRQTDTLWSQLIGEAVEGELAGTKLEYLPSWMTTWLDWKTRYPDTVALEKGYSGQVDPYTGYYLSEEAGVIGEDHVDDRLARKQWIVGVSLGDTAVAYPFLALNKESIVMDTIGGTPVLVVFDKNTANSAVFDRTTSEGVLTFEIVEGVTLVDRETGSTWDGLTGEAIEGGLKGETLRRLKSTSSFWFGWKDFYPDTKVYGEQVEAE
jgi:hypothetical protein